MKKYPPKAIKSPVKLNKLHQACGCVKQECRTKGKLILTLPLGSECLDCDICKVFFSKKRRKPDHVIYINVGGYKPQLVIVEVKRSAKNASPVKQIQDGIKTMKEHPSKFNVFPLPQRLLGVLSHDRKKVRVSEIVLADAKYRIRYLGINGRVIPLPYGTGIACYLVPD